MDIVNPQIEAYLDKVLTVESSVLREMQRYAETRHFPIVGPQVGRLLYLLAQTIGATRVLELGSGFGYSAMWFASAVGPQGRVVMTDSSKQNLERARDYFKRAGMSRRIEMEQGNALEILNRLPGWFDLIYNDIDKRDYPLTIDPVRAKLRPGGLFVTDNMLWSGTVLNAARSSDVRGIKEFTKRLIASPDFATTILPIRDGIAVSLKLE